MELKKAVVLVSGGLDSATVLAMATSKSIECYCLAIDYGQRHRIELEASQRISNTLNARAHKLVKIDLQTIGGSALTDPEIAVPEAPPEPGQQLDDIPVTYVPARNTIFLSIALGWAEVLGINDIYIGVNAVDYSGYPDCRPEYIDAFEKMANLATRAGVEGQHLTVHTPLIAMTKDEIIKQGVSLGLDYSPTISCYQATTAGLACGNCDSCMIRRRGFVAAGVSDPTRYK